MNFSASSCISAVIFLSFVETFFPTMSNSSSGREDVMRSPMTLKTFSAVLVESLCFFLAPAVRESTAGSELSADGLS